VTELQWLTASEIGAAYAARRLSPVELVRALLREIEARNPDCGAFIRVDAEGALDTARRAETDIVAGRSLGPLHGIPLGVKDNIDIAGVPTTCHSKILLDNIARNDAPAIANLRAAGAIMLGKQSLHEFAFGGPSKELPFPFARHPWNTDYHPGGSSSGSGVALAAGFVPLSLGTDAGGSIRNPAGNCGVVGLKPTYDLVSRRGVFPVAFTLDHVGPMARSVADVALFLSTIAGDGSETGNPTGTARRVGLWALTNTKSLESASPSLGITSRLVNSQTYVYPPKSDQKPGDFPLGQCINDTTLPTVFGPGCWQLLFVDEPAHDEVISTPDSLDSRMQQTWYVNGTLWGASGTAVQVGGELKAGIAWFSVDPKINGAGKVEGNIKKQGYVALANNNLTMPAIAMTASGKGAIAFTIMGEDYHPSAGYVTIDANGTVGPIHVAAPGVGVDDGFTSYKAFVGDPPRTRWGDYGAAVTDGSSIWIASEYIAQTCALTGSPTSFYPSPPSTAGFGSCDATRTSLANWSTRMSKLTP